VVVRVPRFVVIIGGDLGDCVSVRTRRRDGRVCGERGTRAWTAGLLTARVGSRAVWWLSGSRPSENMVVGPAGQRYVMSQ